MAKPRGGNVTGFSSASRQGYRGVHNEILTAERESDCSHLRGFPAPAAAPRLPGARLNHGPRRHPQALPPRHPRRRRSRPRPDPPVPGLARRRRRRRHARAERRRPGHRRRQRAHFGAHDAAQRGRPPRLPLLHQLPEPQSHPTWRPTPRPLSVSGGTDWSVRYGSKAGSPNCPQKPLSTTSASAPAAVNWAPGPPPKANPSPTAPPSNSG